MKDPKRLPDRPIKEYQNQEKKDSLIAGLILGSVLFLFCISLVPQACWQKWGGMVIRMMK